MSRRVTVTLTEEQWLAIESCANCAADTHEDVLNVLGSAARVEVLNRGMNALRAALYHAGSYDRYLRRRGHRRASYEDEVV